MAGTALADTTLKLVEVITSPERTETLKSIVGKFEAANPGTKVEIISLPWGEAFEKFATMVSAGDTPDVVEMPDTWQALYANNGMLENLEPYLAKWEHTGGPDASARWNSAATSTTRPTCCPTASICAPCSTTRSCSSEAGVKEPPKTLDEFAAAAKKISASSRANMATACAAAPAASTAG